MAISNIDMTLIWSIKQNIPLVDILRQTENFLKKKPCRLKADIKAVKI